MNSNLEQINTTSEESRQGQFLPNKSNPRQNSISYNPKIENATDQDQSSQVLQNRVMRRPLAPQNENCSAAINTSVVSSTKSSRPPLAKRMQTNQSQRVNQDDSRGLNLQKFEQFYIQNRGQPQSQQNQTQQRQYSQTPTNSQSQCQLPAALSQAQSAQLNGVGSIPTQAHQYPQSSYQRERRGSFTKRKDSSQTLNNSDFIIEEKENDLSFEQKFKNAPYLKNMRLSKISESDHKFEETFNMKGTRTRIVSAKPFSSRPTSSTRRNQNAYSSGGVQSMFRSNSATKGRQEQNQVNQSRAKENSQPQIQPLVGNKQNISIQIKNYDKPARSILSAKPSNSSLIAAGLNIVGLEAKPGNQRNAMPSLGNGQSVNASSNISTAIVSKGNIIRRAHSRQSQEEQNISAQVKGERQIPERHISLLKEDNSPSDSPSYISYEQSRPIASRRVALTKQNSQQRMQNQPFEYKRQNSALEQTESCSQSTANTSTSVVCSQAERLRRLHSIQTNIPLPHITAQSWSIYDAKALKFLSGKKENYKREIASLTKMMTFYTCLTLMQKYSIEGSTLLTVSRCASRTNGTSACLREGDQLTIDQLFYGLMLPSGNDAAYCLAEYFGSFLYENKYKTDQTQGGSTMVTSFQFQWSIVRYFLKEMNLNAFKLRMFQSQFDSPHGLANKHNYSTAADVCLLATKCMTLLKFREVVNTVELRTEAKSSPLGKKLTKYHWENTNKLLGQVDGGFIGCKTGITNPAGPCFCGNYEKDGNNFIIVVLCSKSMEARWVEVPKMADWAVKKRKVNEAQASLSSGYGSAVGRSRAATGRSDSKQANKYQQQSTESDQSTRSTENYAHKNQAMEQSSRVARIL